MTNLQDNFKVSLKFTHTCTLTKLSTFLIKVETPTNMLFIVVT